MNYIKFNFKNIWAFLFTIFLIVTTLPILCLLLFTGPGGDIVASLSIKYLVVFLFVFFFLYTLLISQPLLAVNSMYVKKRYKTKKSRKGRKLPLFFLTYITVLSMCILYFGIYFVNLFFF